MLRSEMNNQAWIKRHLLVERKKSERKKSERKKSEEDISERDISSSLTLFTKALYDLQVGNHRMIALILPFVHMTLFEFLMLHGAFKHTDKNTFDKIARGCFQKMEMLQEANFLHMDISINNFGVYWNKESPFTSHEMLLKSKDWQLCLYDYGNGYVFRDKSSKTKIPYGTIMTSSSSVTACNAASFADDLEATMYVLLSSVYKFYIFFCPLLINFVKKSHSFFFSFLVW